MIFSCIRNHLVLLLNICLKVVGAVRMLKTSIISAIFVLEFLYGVLDLSSISLA